MTLLPAQDAWCSAAASSLIDGSNLVVRGLPATGKTTLVDGLKTLLGPSALVIDGRSFTEADRDAAVDGLRQQVLDLVEAHGCAQLLFDNYPHALRRSYGAHVQRTLLHLLVDGPHAREVGALLTGRWSRSLHLRVRGSPLIARAEHLLLPEPGDADLALMTSDEDELIEIRSAVGGSCALLTRVRRVAGRLDLSLARSAADQMAQSWVDDLPLGAVVWLRELIAGTSVALPDGEAWEAVQPLLVLRDEDGCDLAGVVEASPFPNLLAGRSPHWPDSWAHSVSQFEDLIGGVSDLIWVDRYLLKDPCRLLAFVEELRLKTSARLRLLFSSSVTIAEIKADLACVQRLSEVADCELRAITPRFYGLLHDRQLAFLGDRSDGVVLPTSDVILGTAPVGTALAVRVGLMDRQLHEDAWAAAVRLESLGVGLASKTHEVDRSTTGRK